MAGILGMIANPAQADVLGAMDKGRERQANKMAGDILSKTMSGQIGALAKLDPDKAIALDKALGTDSKSRREAMIGDAIMATKLIDAGMPQEAAQIFSEKSQFLNGLGIDTSRYDLTSQGILNGDPEIIKNLTTFGRAMDPSANKGEQFTLGKDQARYDSRGNLIAGNTGTGPTIDKDFLKEERGVASTTMKALRKRSSVINSSIGKIESLIPQIKNGSRAAAGGAIMSLARLISPGVVTDADFQAMSGAADPVATLMSRLTEKGESGKPLLEALQASYDPTNPDLIDADAILNIARSVVGAEVPSILQEYKESESRGRRSGMNKRQFNTIFGDSESITGLSRYVSKTGKYEVEEL